MSTLADLYAAAPSTQILVDGYDLQANNSGYHGNIRFWFAGTDLQAFTYCVTGKAQTLTIGTTTVTRLIPLVHPYISGNCYCDDIRVYPPEGAIASVDANTYSGYEDGTGGISFSDYFADVHFSTPTFQMEGEGSEYPTVNVTLSCGKDMVTRPGSAYIFPSDGTRLNHDVGIPVATQDFSLAMNRLPSLDTDLYTSLSGCVNLTEFFGMAIGCVLYEGAECGGQFIIGGNPSFTVTHKIKYRSIPWNQIMRPDGAGFEAPVEVTEESDDETEDEDVEDPRYMFPEGELNDLIGM